MAVSYKILQQFLLQDEGGEPEMPETPLEEQPGEEPLEEGDDDAEDDSGQDE